MEEAPVLESMVKQEQVSFGFDQKKRYVDVFYSFFDPKRNNTRYSAVFDGKTFFRRENKFVTSSSLKSSVVERCVYFNMLLWPFSEDDFTRCENEEPGIVRFLPHALNSNWEISISQDLVTAVESDKSRTFVFDKSIGYSLVSYRFDQLKTGIGFGDYTCILSDHRLVDGIHVPFKIVGTTDVFHPKTQKIATSITTELTVSSILLNGEVDRSFFEFKPSPGETLVDHDKGTIENFIDGDENRLSNTMVAAKDLLVSSRGSGSGPVTHFAYGILALVAGAFAAWLVEKLPKKNRTLVFVPSLVFAMHSTAYSNAMAQEIKQDLSSVYSRGYRQLFSVNSEGQLYATRRPHKRFNTPLPILELLSIDEVANSLEVVSYQRKEIEEIQEAIRTAIDQSRAKIEESISNSGTISDGTKADVLSLLTPGIAKGNAVLKKVLLPHQIEELQKIFAILQLRQTGLLAALVHGELGNILELSPRTKADLEKTYLNAFESAKEDINTAKREAVERTINSIPRSARLELDGANISRLAGRMPASFVVKLLSGKVEERSDEVKQRNPWPEYEAFLYTNDFLIKLDGTIEFQEKPDRFVASYITIPDGLMQLSQSNQCIHLLDLSDNQVFQLKQVQDIKANHFNKKSVLLDIHIETFGYTKLNEFQEKMRTNRKDVGKQIVDKIKDILTPQQLSKLEYLVKNAGFQRLGFTVFGDGLKKSTAEEGEQASQALRDTLIKIEADINKTLISRLSKSDQSRFNSLLPKGFEKESGNCELHFLFCNPVIGKSIVGESKKLRSYKFDE